MIITHLNAPFAVVLMLNRLKMREIFFVLGNAVGGMICFVQDWSAHRNVRMNRADCNNLHRQRCLRQAIKMIHCLTLWGISMRIYITLLSCHVVISLSAPRDRNSHGLRGLITVASTLSLPASLKRNAGAQGFRTARRLRQISFRCIRSSARWRECLTRLGRSIRRGKDAFAFSRRRNSMTGRRKE